MKNLWTKPEVETLDMEYTLGGTNPLVYYDDIQYDENKSAYSTFGEES